MFATLRALLWLLGGSAILICLSIVFFGPGNTAQISELMFDALTGRGGPLTGRWPPTMDSELRFYAPFWGAYGIVLIAVARDLMRLGRWVPWLALLFFVGGLGRAISWAITGAPHPFFLFLMTIELVLPPVLIALWRFGGPPT